jgi:hypothetical protein
MLSVAYTDDVVRSTSGAAQLLPQNVIDLMNSSPCGQLGSKDAETSADIEIAQHPKPCGWSTANDGCAAWDGYDKAAGCVWIFCPPFLDVLLYVLWSAAKDVGRRRELVVLLVLSFLVLVWVGAEAQP